MSVLTSINLEKMKPQHNLGSREQKEGTEMEKRKLEKVEQLMISNWAPYLPLCSPHSS